MRIAIVNNKLDGSWRGYLESLADSLRDGGYDVDLSPNISELPSPLGNYGLAIVHPNKSDVPLFFDEVSKRKDFRLMIDSSNPEDYSEGEHYESSQVCSLGWILSRRNRERLMEKISDGW